MPRPRQLAARERRRVEVHYREAGKPSLIGFSGNVSSRGMMIRTPRVHAPGTVLDIELRLPGGSLKLQGRVIWAREGPMSWLMTGKIGMGIEFIDPPSDLEAVVKSRAAR